MSLPEVLALIGVPASPDTSVRVTRCTDPRRPALADWLTRHSVDPCMVPIPCVLVRDVVNRRIYHPRLHRGPDGFPLLVNGRAVIDDDAYTQLESPPSPFPATP